MSDLWMIFRTTLAIGCLSVCLEATAELKATGVAEFDAAVQRAVDFLRQVPDLSEREQALAAYAMLKAGVDPTEPRIAEGIANARRRAQASSFDQYHGSYLAGVDAMLLADSDAEQHLPELQKIADQIVSYQREDGSWGDTRNDLYAPADVSLIQYCVLALWAAQRAGCRIEPVVFDRAAQFLTENGNSDGGWAYRPGTNMGPEEGQSGHNMTMAAIGTIGISRLILFGVENIERPDVKFGVLERLPGSGGAVKGGNSTVTLRAMNESINRGLTWNRVRFKAIPDTPHLLYFYYTLERAASLVQLRENWFERYGNALLSLQQPDGSFAGHSSAYGPAVGTSFAVLFFVRSTQQIIDASYGRGVTQGYRDLVTFLQPKGRSDRPIGPLDELLAAMEGQNFADLDVDTDEVVQKIKFSSREELIGEAAKLKILVKSPDAGNRQIAYWALSRTGDFDLIPLMLDGLNDPSINVNVEALSGLRYISRQPKGLGISMDPLAQAPPGADDTARLNAARVWRAKASSVWRAWYSKVRPYSERDGLDELGLPLD